MELVRSTQARSDAGDADRLVAGDIGPILNLEKPVYLSGSTDDAVHLGSGSRRSTMAEIKGQTGLLLGHVDEHLPVTGNGRGPGLHHGQTETHGNRGVNGVSTFRQDLDPHLGSQGMGGHNRSKIGYDLVLDGSPDTAFHLSSLPLATVTRFFTNCSDSPCSPWQIVVTAFDRIRIPAGSATPESQIVEYARSAGAAAVSPLSGNVTTGRLTLC